MPVAHMKLLFLLVATPWLTAVHWGCSSDPLSGAGQSQGERSKGKALDEAALTMRRAEMVREQLKGRDITDDRVLSAMGRVLRHTFVPPELIQSAYDDNALPLHLGQTISQPYIVAYMTQALELHGTERVLEIGTGSGYQTAVLAEIASAVYTIEILPELEKQARAVLSELGYGNIHFRVGDGYSGWPDEAPFDRIIVTAAPETIPQPLIDQLKEGGRMAIPVGVMNQELIIVEKGPSGIARRTSIPVRFVPMTGKAQDR